MHIKALNGNHYQALKILSNQMFLIKNRVETQKQYQRKLPNRIKGMKIIDKQLRQKGNPIPQLPSWMHQTNDC